MPITQGTVDKKYVSAIDFLDQRDIDPKIYDQSRDRALTDIMKLGLRYKPCKMYNYHTWVNNDIFETGTVSAVTSTGLAQIQFTINTAATFPRVGDHIRSSNSNNTGKQARIQAVTFASGTALLTVRTPNNVPFYATVNDTISFGGNSYGEGSGAPTSRRYGLTKYFNLIQIFKEADDITDVQSVALIEAEVGGDSHILPYQTLLKALKLKADINYSMLAGVQSVTQFGDANGFLQDASGNNVQTTGGLDWYTTTYGITDQSAVLGTFSFVEVDDMIDNWLANKAPLDQMGFMGTRPKRILDKYFKNTSSSGVTSVKMEIDGRAIDFQVDHISYAGAELDFVYLPIYDHPQLSSATLSPDISGSIFWVPKDGVDTVDGGREARLMCRYTPSPFRGTKDGIISEWRTGALAETPTNSTATLHTDWYSAQGLEARGVKHFQRYRIV